MIGLELLAIPLIAAVIGFALGYAAQHFKVEGDPLAEQINGFLPNGQCGQCGYPGCLEAAKAMARGEAKPDICAPGGSALAKKIADVLGVPLAEGEDSGPKVAAIDMAVCDGCGRCQKQCSFDAIVGAPRQLHGIIADACTGCNACTSVCPQQAIHLYPDPAMTLHIRKPDLLLNSIQTPSGVPEHA